MRRTAVNFFIGIRISYFSTCRHSYESLRKNSFYPNEKVLRKLREGTFFKFDKIVKTHYAF